MIEMLQRAVAMGGSDIFIIPGAPVTVKVNNELEKLTKLSKKLGGNMTKGMLMPYQAVIDKAKPKETE